jgi:hypothetical protein
MNKAERRQYQEQLEADASRAGDDRGAAAERHHHRSLPCPAALGRNHNFTMRGNDGKYRCWYCCKTRAEVAP